MAKPRVFVSRIIAQEALEKIAQMAEMEVWQDESYHHHIRCLWERHGLLMGCSPC